MGFGRSSRQGGVTGVNGKPAEKPSRIDWAKADSTRDRDIDYGDNPPLDDDFWNEAVLLPGPKQQMTIRLDRDVVTYFESRGKGYQTAINAVLRRCVGGRTRSDARDP